MSKKAPKQPKPKADKAEKPKTKTQSFWLAFYNVHLVSKVQLEAAENERKRKIQAGIAKIKFPGLRNVVKESKWFAVMGETTYAMAKSQLGAEVRIMHGDLFDRLEVFSLTQISKSKYDSLNAEADARMRKNPPPQPDDEKELLDESPEAARSQAGQEAVDRLNEGIQHLDPDVRPF